MDGANDGLYVEASVGATDGLFVGKTVGAFDGETEGDVDGFKVGAMMEQLLDTL